MGVEVVRRLTCDRCGRSVEVDEAYSFANDSRAAMVASANVHERGWTDNDGDILCPTCHESLDALRERQRREYLRFMGRG